MSIYDDDWGDDVQAPKLVTLADQARMSDLPVKRNTFVPAAPTRTITAYPVQTPANEGLGMVVAGLMAEARTIHHADPISRGLALLIKASAITAALALFTVAALIMLDSMTFFLWLLLASIEWVGCFLFLAYNDWREHPSAIRWTWTQGLLGMMENEQRARLNAQYGKDWDQ